MTIKERARELIAGEVDGVLGYRILGGSHLPHFFTAPDVEDMAEDYPADERYPLAYIVRRLQAENPGFDSRSWRAGAMRGQSSSLSSRGRSTRAA